MTHAEIEWKILEVFYRCNIKSFPINLFDLLAQYGYECIEYSEQPEKKQRACMTYSEDSFKLNDKVYYNDTVSFCRRRFSLAHELGHIALGHAAPYTQKMEQEANYFASHILAPRMAIHYARCKNASDVAKIFKMTFKAAGYAFDDYRRWRRHVIYHKMSNLDKCMYAQFYNKQYDCFVWNISICKRCKSEFINNPDDYCGMCEHYERELKYLDDALLRKMRTYQEPEHIPGFIAAESKREQAQYI